METETFTADYENISTTFAGPAKPSTHIRKLSFGETFSPMNKPNDHLEEIELDFLTTGDTRTPSDPHTSSRCYKKLFFSPDNQRRDPFYPSPQPWCLDEDQVIESDEFVMEGLSARHLTPNNSAGAMNYDMQFNSANKPHQPMHEILLSKKKANRGAFEDLLLDISRANSQEIFRRSQTCMPFEDSGMNVEEDTGYFSTPKKFLPTCKSQMNPDLSTITPQTLVDLMTNTQRQSYLVIDCRYDYEYKGGHIKGAINIESPEILELLFVTYRHYLFNRECLNQIKDNFPILQSQPHLFSYLSNNPTPDCVPILIFHCEFSQKRGPRGLRLLRELDREMNNWPNSTYPEVYILEGGYRNFHSKFPVYCTPEGSYIRMIDERYKDMYCQSRQREKMAWKEEADYKDSKPKCMAKIPTLARSKTVLYC